MLQKADLNIMEYKPIVEDRLIPNDFREHIQKENIPEEMKEALLKPTTDSITFLNHSAKGDFDIPLKWQSKGTLKYIRILDALYDMISGSHVYLLDELGEDLHNDLLFPWRLIRLAQESVTIQFLSYWSFRSKTRARQHLYQFGGLIWESSSMQIAQ